LKEPIKLTVRKGRVIKIEGGVEAKQFEEYVKKYGDETSYECPAEISVGINPLAAPTGVVRTDKKLLGAVHIAMGYYYAGPLHLDGIIRYPTVYVDNKLLVEKGRINIGTGRF
jgi:leucyl aminopeptidase (aminopeptidase T)